MTESIRAAMSRAWTTLFAGPPGDREWRALRIATDHPLDVFIAIREQDMAPGVLFECPISVAPTWRLRFESEGLRLSDDRAGRDGTRRIALALERKDLESVFLVIAEDLIASSKAAGEGSEAVTALGVRLTAWQTCLKLRRDGFSQERALGLYGELVLLMRLGLVIGLDRAIAVWSGPERGLHDFEALGAAIEVKTSLGPRGVVRISSLNQLDDSGIQALTLCRVVAIPDDGGVDLPSLVSTVRHAADAMGTSVRLSLDQRLLMSGYIDPNADTHPFDRLTVSDVEAYAVHDKFPRLTRETVNPAVLSAEYSLDVALAAEYRLTNEAFEANLARFGMGA